MFYGRKPRHTHIMEVDRVKSFSDNIFGFAMTLLIARITIPNVPLDEAAVQLPLMLIHEWRHFAIYTISFLGIGGYWVLHHNIFAHVQATDKTMIWLNMLLLLTVTFLPYPTALMGKYGRDTLTASVYGITISVNYLLLNVICWYICADERFLKPNFEPHEQCLFQIRLLIPLIIALIGTALSFFYFRLSFLFYFLVILANALPLKFLSNRFNRPNAELPNPG